jgi:hypothetical protein
MEATKNDHISTLNTFATGVAAALSTLTGDTWTVSRPANADLPSAAYVGDGVRSLSLYLPMYGTDGKVNVGGNYPDEARNTERVYLHPEVNGYKGTSRPSINVSATRPAKQVAADINRRLLPDYDAIRVYIVDQVAKSTDAEARLAAAVASMAAVLDVPVPTRRYENDKQPAEVSVPTTRTAWGALRANHDGSSWTVDLHSVPTEVAERIARLLRADK